MNLNVQPYHCPFCNASLSLHTTTNYSVCSHCTTVIHKKQSEDLEAFTIDKIQSSNDTIQINKKGKWNDKTFTVLGKFRLWFAESVFNYWTIIFEDGTTSYLAEAYGLFFIYDEIEITQNSNSPFLNTVSVGEYYKLNNEDYVLERTYKSKQIEVEGEFYLPENVGDIIVYEFASIAGTYVSIHRYSNNNIKNYNVSVTSFQELFFENINTVELTNSYNFNCNHCNTNIQLKNYPYSQSCCCPKCETRYYLGDNKTFKPKDNNKIDGAGFCFDIGEKIILEKISYEIIGLTIKQENNQYKAKWREYVLFNKIEGYAFMSEFNGHFIYLKEQGQAPTLKINKSEEFTYDNKFFELFNNYRFDTLFAKGEFPNNGFNDGSLVCNEYISPPYIWIREKNKSEGITWFYGKHISRNEIKKQTKNSLPYKTGVGAVEPKGNSNNRSIMIFTLAILFIATITDFAVNTTKQNKTLVEESFYIPDSAQIFITTIDNIYLPKSSSNINFNIIAPVDNSWLEVSAKLVDKKTGTEFAIEQGIEYYYGYSDGESWSEGSREEDMMLSSVPQGNYVLQLQATCDSYKKVDHFNIRATYDTPINRNYWMIIILLMIWPIAQYLLNYYYEKARWEDSPFGYTKTLFNDDE